MGSADQVLQTICRQLNCEQDSAKLEVLVEQLNRVLDQLGGKKTPDRAVRSAAKRQEANNP